MNKYILFLLLPLLAACSNYGPKVNSSNIEVYYKEGISKEQAEKTAGLFDRLLKASNPNDNGKKSFQLQKSGDTILLKMVADASKLKAVGDDAFYAITTMVSDSVFSGAVVNLTLTDNTFKGFKEYAFRKSAISTWGAKFISGKVEVYDDGVGQEQTSALADFMTAYFEPQTIFSFQLSKDETDRVITKMVVNPDRMNFFTDEVLLEISKGISEKVLNGAPVHFELTDTQFNTLRRFSYPVKEQNQ